MGSVGWRWCRHVHKVNGGGCRVVRCSVGLVGGGRIVGPVGLVVSKYIKEQEYLKYCLFLVELF